MSDTYDIKRVVDFLKIPREKRGVCLREFEVWLSLHDLAQSCGMKVVNSNVFRWIDDDMAKCQVRFLDKEGDQFASLNIKMKKP